MYCNWWIRVNTRRLELEISPLWAVIPHFICSLVGLNFYRNYFLCYTIYKYQRSCLYQLQHLLVLFKSCNNLCNNFYKILTNYCVHISNSKQKWISNKFNVITVFIVIHNSIVLPCSIYHSWRPGWKNKGLLLKSM